MKQSYLLRPKGIGFSLLEISVSMLLMSYLLLMSCSTLLNLLSDSKIVGHRIEAYQLARNLMETLLSLPESEAKVLDVANDPHWTAKHKFSVQVNWKPYTNPHLEKMIVEYRQDGHQLIQLVTLKPYNTSVNQN